jgi:putative transcriptional regulator
MVMKNKLGVYREQIGVSQGELATAVGVSRQIINAVDRYDPSIELAFKLAAYFDFRIEELFAPDIEPVGE